MVDKIINVYAVNAKTLSRKRFKLLQMLSKITELFLKFGIIGGSCCGMFFIVNPFITYVWLNEMKPMIPIYMPFIDENTMDGFLLLTLIQTVFIVTGVIGTVSVDFLIFMIVLNVPIFSNIFSDNVTELNAILSGDDDEDKQTLIKMKLRNLFFMYDEIWQWVVFSFFCLSYSRFVREFSNIFFTFTQLHQRFEYINVFTLLNSSVMRSRRWCRTNIRFLKGLWYFNRFFFAWNNLLLLFLRGQIEPFPSFGLAFAFVWQIILICVIGTIVEICVWFKLFNILLCHFTHLNDEHFQFQNDQVDNSLMNGDWHLLTITDQMKYKFLMQHTQLAKSLTIGGIAPLNMMSCVTVRLNWIRKLFVIHFS